MVLWSRFDPERNVQLKPVFLSTAKFVKEQHFGGGLFTKRGTSEGDTQDGDKSKSRKEWIDEIIAESKKKKAESRKEKDEQYETVAKLDSELQNFMKLMANHKLTDEDKEKVCIYCIYC